MMTHHHSKKRTIGGDPSTDSRGREVLTIAFCANCLPQTYHFFASGEVLILCATFLQLSVAVPGSVSVHP